MRTSNTLLELVTKPMIKFKLYALNGMQITLYHSGYLQIEKREVCDILRELIQVK